MKRIMVAAFCIGVMMPSCMLSMKMKKKLKSKIEQDDKKDLQMQVCVKTCTKKKACVVFAHGFRSSGEAHANKYVKAGMFPLCDVASFEFPDSPRAAGNNGKVDASKTCFGQDDEQEVLEEKFEEIQEKYDKIILAGVSRGAIAVLNSDLKDEVVGIFVESPASSLEDVAQDQCKQYGFGWIPGLGKVLHDWALPYIFRNYDPKGAKPIEYVVDVPYDVPVFISYVKNDCLIPATSSIQLAEELVENGHPEVYLYDSQVGQHGCMFSDEYTNVTHAFLKRCGALDKNYNCQDGDILLAACLVSSVEEVQEIKKEAEWASWKSFLGRNLAVLSALVTGVTFLAKKALSVIK